MTKKSFYILFLLFSIISCASAQPQSDSEVKEYHSENIDLQMHNELKQRWIDSGIDSYTATVRFNAFSPHRGLWEIEVLNGKLLHCKFGGRLNQVKDMQTASIFLQENLYIIAANAYRDSDLYIYSIRYDKNGFITYVGKRVNPDTEKQGPTDTGFKIIITKTSF
jgi:hypothetical protein